METTNERISTTRFDCNDATLRSLQLRIDAIERERDALQLYVDDIESTLYNERREQRDERERSLYEFVNEIRDEIASTFDDLRDEQRCGAKLRLSTIRERVYETIEQLIVNE